MRRIPYWWGEGDAIGGGLLLEEFSTDAREQSLEGL
jgi:hypothetical protein